MGCFLIYTGEDLGKTEMITSLDEAYERLAEVPKGFAEALGDENHPNHQLAMSAALRGVSSDLPKNYKDAFIESVRNICRAEPTIVGLVHNYSYRAPQRSDGRNQGQTTILDTKINAARAAEVISAEAIRRHESSAGNATGNVGALRYNPVTDRLDFQQKFQSRHPDKGRGSVEGDFTINRQVKDLTGLIVNYVTLGVDVKHSTAGTFGKMPGLDAQLKGVVDALLVGEVAEFHFVTNNAFGKDFKRAIEAANASFWAKEEGEALGDERLMGETERNAHREARRERGGKIPKIFWHEAVWLEGFK